MNAQVLWKRYSTPVLFKCKVLLCSWKKCIGLTGVGVGPSRDGESQTVGRRVFSRKLTHFWVVPSLESQTSWVISLNYFLSVRNWWWVLSEFSTAGKAAHGIGVGYLPQDYPSQLWLPQLTVVSCWHNQPLGSSFQRALLCLSLLELLKEGHQAITRGKQVEG